MKWLVPRAVSLMFSTYTSIPSPRVEWDSAASRLALGFLPLAGVLVGAAMYGWSALCAALGIGDTLFAAVAAALPVLISGGIHLDGFCDTVDALSSRAPRERKLEILKDPNAGAFAVIYCCVYLILVFGLFTQSRDGALSVALGYVLSRALTAICAVLMPGARKDGMLSGMTQGAYKGAIIALCTVFGALALGGMLMLDLQSGFIALALVAAVTAWYIRLALRQFGGVTGDTSGFFLQITELAVLIAATAGTLI